VAIDNTNALIVVSFRGSESWRNYLADLNLPLTPTNLCPGCTGAAGFLDAWSEVATTVAAAVKTAHAAHPDYRIVSTGHSLGGAIATLAALDLRKQGFVVDMVSSWWFDDQKGGRQKTDKRWQGTFGAPRVGTDSMARLMSGQDPAQGRNFRVTHKYDPVPSMPALSEGYRHVTPAYHIMTDNTAVPTAKDFEMQVGMLFENAWGLNLVEDGEAHVHYFNHISACYANGTSGGIVW
jgi:hypothetical protein